MHFRGAIDKAGLAEALQGVKAVFLVCGNAKEQATEKSIWNRG